MNFLTWLSRKRFRYEPLIQIELSKKNLIHNLNEFRKLAPKSINGCSLVAPVLKSNAYGHGMFEIAHMLDAEKHIPFYIVDSYFEAVALRARGTKRPILVIGYTRPETIHNSNLGDVSFTITSLDMLRRVAVQKTDRWPSTQGRFGFRSARLRFRPKVVRLHLKIDTGMHRQGILPEEVDEAINLLQHDNAGRRPVTLEGITTHLCDADNVDESFTEAQIHLWNRIAGQFKKEFKDLKFLHVAASDGHRFTVDIDANVSRLGIGLYGLSQNQGLTSRLDLQPVLEMKTIITGIKKLKTGGSVGYGKTYTADHDMVIATIPVGYFEGIDRRLSSDAFSNSHGYVLVGPKRIPCPIIGRVSMNITTIDISHLPQVQLNDEVVAISAKSDEPNSMVNIAKKCGTISYVIAVHIPPHLKRITIST